MPAAGMGLAEWAGGGGMSREDALGIPAVQACIGLVSAVVTRLPLRLYATGGGKREPLDGDPRARLLNDDPGDALDAPQFWNAILRDYFLGKGGYAYVRRARNKVLSLHYVDERQVAAEAGHDPIFKRNSLMVGGRRYQPHEFVIVLRNTMDGASGRGVLQEARLLLGTMRGAMEMERKLMEGEGGKKGIIKPEAGVTKIALEQLREHFELAMARKSPMVMTNQGIAFVPFSASPSELQMQEAKAANSREVCKLFGLPPDLVHGGAPAGANLNRLFAQAMRTGILPVIKIIESALNRVLLLESEKKTTSSRSTSWN